VRQSSPATVVGESGPFSFSSAWRLWTLPRSSSSLPDGPRESLGFAPLPAKRLPYGIPYVKTDKLNRAGGHVIVSMIKLEGPQGFTLNVIAKGDVEAPRSGESS
jgi:hypothetical protein